MFHLLLYRLLLCLVVCMFFHQLLYILFLCMTNDLLLTILHWICSIVFLRCLFPILYMCIQFGYLFHLKCFPILFQLTSVLGLFLLLLFCWFFRYACWCCWCWWWHWWRCGWWWCAWCCIFFFVIFYVVFNCFSAFEC